MSPHHFADNCLRGQEAEIGDGHGKQHGNDGTGKSASEAGVFQFDGNSGQRGRGGEHQPLIIRSEKSVVPQRAEGSQMSADGPRAGEGSRDMLSPLDLLKPRKMKQQSEVSLNVGLGRVENRIFPRKRQNAKCFLTL
jgi:hypothetical protein